MIRNSLLRRLVEDEVEAGNGDEAPQALAERMAYTAIMEKYGPAMVEVSDPSSLGRELLGSERDTGTLFDLIINQRPRFPSYGDAARALFPDDSLLTECADFWDDVEAAERELRVTECKTVAELLQ